jgi:hypothetical protein
MSIGRQAIDCTVLKWIIEKSIGALRQTLWIPLAGFAWAGMGQVASGQLLPTDAMASCKVEPMEFAGWFEGAAVTSNGFVNPANSVNFPNHVDCDFYKWSSRMFLWLSSRTANGGRIFESPVFFSVSAPASDGSRSLIQNAPDNLNADVRSAQIIEKGQAGTHGVLMAQNGSLVYYASKVNDVFAYFLTRAKNPGAPSPPDKFPTEQGQLDKIKAFAATRGVTFPYPDVLVVEVKTAWVEADGLDVDKYITINATIPTFDKSDSSKWRPNGFRRAQLALVGLHVAGSANGQEDLIWATFEHVNNVPVASYSYKNTNGDKIDIPASAGGPWLFSSSSTGPFNVRRQHAEQVPLVAADPPGASIGPSDTRREQPWGTDPAINAESVATNTDIISLNSSIMRMLASEDSRKNYLLIGATWNFNEGSRRLANSTIETYVQNIGCLRCHKGDNPGSRDGGISHVFGALKPLSP